MNSEQIKQEIEKIIKKCGSYGELIVKEIDLESKDFSVFLPFSPNELVLDFEGETEEEIIDDIIRAINSELDTMEDHLNDCKIYK